MRWGAPALRRARSAFSRRFRVASMLPIRLMTFEPSQRTGADGLMLEVPP
jgi:hypothetical protein